MHRQVCPRKELKQIDGLARAPDEANASPKVGVKGPVRLAKKIADVDGNIDLL